MIQEVRRQFREIPGILDGTGEPDYKSCVDISTKAALHEIVCSWSFSCSCTVTSWNYSWTCIIGRTFSWSTLVTGVMLALMMSNSGGAWDNAKVYRARKPRWKRK